MASTPLRGGGKPLSFWCGLADCANAVEDEVFEEEESAESEGDSARPCHPVCDRGRRIENACGASPATPIHLGVVCGRLGVYCRNVVAPSSLSYCIKKLRRFSHAVSRHVIGSG